MIDRKRRLKTGYEKTIERKTYKRNWIKNDRKKRPWYYAHRDILNRTIKDLKIDKVSKTNIMLGYTSNELKLHMESLFIEGMSWENHGEWHIDHIIPLSSFTINDQANEINSLENLQTLWAKENLSKYNK